MPGWSARVGRWPTGGTRRRTWARRRLRKRHSAECGEGNLFLHGIGAGAIAWTTATRDAPRVAARDRGGCNIKGNISHNSGRRIYHMPGDRDYERTRISTSRGERYFCTEAEARAAGWRRAGR